MISPFGALRWNRNLPAWSLLISNLAAIDFSLGLGVVGHHASNAADQVLAFLYRPSNSGELRCGGRERIKPPLRLLAPYAGELGEPGAGSRGGSDDRSDRVPHVWHRAAAELEVL